MEPIRSLLAISFNQPSRYAVKGEDSSTTRVLHALPDHLLKDIGFKRTNKRAVEPIVA